MKILDYFKETKAEMKHVNWPTRRQAVSYTAVVIGITLAFAVFLGLLDFVFSLGLENIIS